MPLVQCDEDSVEADTEEGIRQERRAPYLTSGSSEASCVGQSSFFAHLFSLSIITGRLLELMYGPNGVRYTSSAVILGIRDALDGWREGLPRELVAKNRWATREAGELDRSLLVVLPVQS